MKKQNETNFLTLNKVRNKWTKTEEYKKLDELEKRKRDEFLSEMRNYFTEEEMKAKSIYELERKFFKFSLAKFNEFSYETDAFLDYIDTLTERYKLKQFNPTSKVGRR